MVVYELASKQDAEAIFALQQHVFKVEADKSNDFQFPALIETYNDFFLTFSDYVYLVIKQAGSIIGSIRGKQVGTICKIERFVIHPGFQNKKLGTVLLQKLESLFSDVNRFELITRSSNERNLYFYQKNAYAILKKDYINQRDVIIFYKEKVSG